MTPPKAIMETGRIETVHATELEVMTSMRERIKGSIPALITPMKNGKVDEAAFRKFVSWQIEQGSQGLVPCGTTG